jgi:hypothetical protein
MASRGPRQNATTLLERMREGSLIAYRVPGSPAGQPAAKAIVVGKQVIGDTISLLCQDFQGRDITVDPRWVTHVGC